MTLSRPRRAFLREVHLWLALAIGLPVAFVCALGLPITYWGASDAFFDPTFYGVGRSHAASKVDFDRLAAMAISVPRAVRLTGISLQREGQTAIATVASRDNVDREVSLDPATGDVMGVRDPQKSVIFILYSLHTRLLLDRLGFDTVGKAIIMTLAAGVLALIVSGVLLWWPLRWRWEVILPVVRRRHVWRDLHNKMGLYALIPLFLASLTALLLSVPATRDLGSDAPPRMPLHFSEAAAEITLNEAAQIGGMQSAGRTVVGIFDIDDPKRWLVLTGADEANERWIVVDRHNGRPMSVTEARPIMPTDHGDPVFLLGLHQGHRFGSLGQALFAVAATVPTLLFATGLWLWIRRHHPRRKRPTSRAT